MQWPPSPGPGIERHEAKRFSGRRVDHFPDIDTHAVAHDGDLVHQADIDHAEGVFEQLHHLGNLRGTDRHHMFERLRVEQTPQFRAGRRSAAHYFRDVLRLEIRVARIDALRRKAQEKIFADLQAAIFPASAAPVRRWCPDTWSIPE